MVWIWASLFLVTLVIEIFTEELVSIWFSLGSFVAFFLALCTKASLTVQIIAFLATSVVLMICTRKVFIKMLKNSKGETNIDSLVGTSHKLTKEIVEDQAGQVKINDVEWRAYSENKKSIKINKKVKIIAVNGNKLIVEEDK